MTHQDRLRSHHACRLLVLLAEGGDDSIEKYGPKVIRGTVKLAKMDFLLRYPQYLAAAVRIVSPTTHEYWARAPHEPMAKYLMGPFENDYYNIFGILESKDLARIKNRLRRERQFYLTAKGLTAVNEHLYKEPRYLEYREPSRVIRQFFGNMTGPQLKDFLYEHFPKIGDTGLDDIIPENPEDAK